MLIEKDIQELIRYTPGKPVLTVYLNTDPSDGNADAYRLRLRKMLKEVDAPEDVQRVEDFFAREYDWTGRSVAVFSCAAGSFFTAFPLAIPVTGMVRVSNYPHIKPLADLWDAYGGYGVALVDKQGARLFHFGMGVLEEQDGFMGDTVRHVKKGGASSMAGRRGGSAGTTGFEDEVEERNMKEAAAFAARFFESNHIRRVIIGGTEENISVFIQHLPKTWQSLVAGTYHLPVTASLVEVQKKAHQIGLEAERKREAQLIETTITAAAKGGNGVTGLEDVLGAVSSYRVQTLMVNEGYYSTGFECPACHHLTTIRAGSCPKCSGGLDPVLDIVDLAIRRVLLDGGDVEVIHGNDVLEKAGRVAARLRF